MTRATPSFSCASDFHWGRLVLLLWAVVLLSPPLSAQVVGRRPVAPAASERKGLSVREASFLTLLTNAESSYGKGAERNQFVLESTRGETRHEWSIGRKELPRPESVQPPDYRLERTVKFLPHEGKLFIRIEAQAKPNEDQDEAALAERRFSGTYELQLLEGNWADYEAGRPLKAKLAKGDHERYLAEMQRSFLGEAVLRKHAQAFGKELLGVLERKVADPGETPAKEIEAVRRILELAKAQPDRVKVEVTPRFEAEPELFLLEGDRLTSTVAKQTTLLRFNATLPAPPPQP